MKNKNKCNNQPVPSTTKETEDSEDEQTFSNWLRSSDGMECLKLFVIGNSLLIFLLVSWPQMKEGLNSAYFIYKEFFPDQE